MYHKPTDSGNCLNGKSECVDKYKSSVITNYLNRAYKVSDSWQNFHNEVIHIKQVLVNNNYSNTVIDQHVKKFLDKKVNLNNSNQESHSVKLYYQNQTHSNYKVEERSIKNIILSNVKCLNEKQKLKIIFYYKNTKTHNLVMKNNLSPRPSAMQQSNLVYKFSCPFPHSKAEEYIGLTQTTLSRRLTMHGQNGSILKHFMLSHNVKPTRDQLTQNTTIIARANDRYKLAIKEALLILNNAPSLNIQFDNFTNILKLHNHRNQQPQFKPPKSNCTPPSQHQNVANRLPPSSLPQNSEIPVVDLASPTPVYGASQNASILISENEGIPNFENILLKFGINFVNLKPVSLQDYQWSNFKDTYLESERFDTETQLKDNSPTISQRIKSMMRGARKAPSAPHT